MLSKGERGQKVTVKEILGNSFLGQGEVREAEVKKRWEFSAPVEGWYCRTTEIAKHCRRNQISANCRLK